MIKLYLKVHNKTGLKYLGKTEQADAHTYTGSGTYWKRHLSKHGNDYSTTILFETDDKELFKTVAQYYSNKFDVVNNKEFANIVPEEGDGGDTSMCENFKNAMQILSTENKKRRWWNNGIKSVFVETPPDETYKLGRINYNNNGYAKGAEMVKGTMWCNNGIEENMFDEIPDGWQLGRLDKSKFTRKNSAKGSKWWNNGIKSVMSIECPGEEFQPGRLYSRKSKV